MGVLPTMLLIAMLAVLAVLVTGLVGFFKGGEFNRKYGNKLMRARVALQAVAILLLLLVLMTGGWRPMARSAWRVPCPSRH
jgi:uncharacterized protein involved in response to NO